MEDEMLSKRLAGLELAVAHLTEAVEEMTKTLDGEVAPSVTRIKSHLRDVRENFNQVVPRSGGN